MPLIIATGGTGEAVPAAEALVARLIARATQGAKAMAVPATSAAVETGNDIYAQTGDPVAALRGATAKYLTTTATGAVPMSLPGNLATRMAAAIPAGIGVGEASRQINNAALPASLQQPFDWEDVFLNGFISPLFAIKGERSPHVDAQKAKENFERFDTISQLSQQAALRNGDPAAFRKMVQDMAEGSNLRTIYVDRKPLSDTLQKQGISQETISAQLPGLTGQLARAAEENGYIAIPVEDYATHIAGSNLDAALLPHFKAAPDGMTYSEAQAFAKQQEQELRKQKENDESINGTPQSSEQPAGKEEQKDEIPLLPPSEHPLFDAEQWAKYQKELQALSPEDRAIAERFADKLRDYDAAVAEYSSIPDTQGGKVLNTDFARELCEDYLKDRTRSEVIQKLSSALVRKMFADKLEAIDKPKVLFSAGGPGSGKSTVLENNPAMAKVAAIADIVYDTTMSDYTSARGMIEQALQAGGKTRIVLVIREPVDALVNGVIRRAVLEKNKYGTGRTVTLDYFLHAHPNAIENVFRLAKEYKGNPDVQFRFVDNTRGKNEIREVPLEQARQIEFQQVEERARNILEEEYRDGKISEKIYTGIKYGVDDARRTR